ncbi:MAG: hypothetical protein COU81_02140 [Candidatus Portnoybacteria bacterium CG10_big_fil_rev_8_21_14_0_10_36_7]|uniref:RNA polymerase subunit sigma-24 n=1 Tax=Candidatus Portnoybacteria bacterium CG10_big_fil_rev_8_21_14_0_10_36_7 TaxID=1974812 RepID=A0A2M8KE39_9BACT|nr:MAG: hypothetical protein COU81_02140 [Candidatus Portnoybacteria bacterium CG10_big_fil_rev_8_21_14_0_10_36_7]
MKSATRKKFIDSYDKYAIPIYRFVYLRVGNEQNAEDITSEVFLRCLGYLEGGHIVDNYRAFLYQTARNLVVDFYRQNGRIYNVPLEDAKQLDLSISIDKPIISKIEVESALRLLKDSYHEAIILYYLEDLSISEISQILERNEGAVRVIIHRALSALKQAISKQ